MRYLFVIFVFICWKLSGNNGPNVVSDFRKNVTIKALHANLKFWKLILKAENYEIKIILGNFFQGYIWYVAIQSRNRSLKNK